MIAHEIGASTLSRRRRQGARLNRVGGKQGKCKRADGRQQRSRPRRIGLDLSGDPPPNQGPTDGGGGEDIYLATS